MLSLVMYNACLHSGIVLILFILMVCFLPLPAVGSSELLPRWLPWKLIKESLWLEAEFKALNYLRDRCRN